MKFGKKMGIGLLAAALSLSIVGGASASSVSAPGYGTLSGSSGVDGDFGVVIHTTISKNPDNAYATAGFSIQDINGKTIHSYTENKGNRGATTADHGTRNFPAASYVVYGTHGVQGGNTYGAKATYTYSHFNR